MYYLVLIAWILFSAGCGNRGLSDTEAPKITGVAIETTGTCKKAGIEVPCLKNLSAAPPIVNVRITGSDDIGIAGYYISSADSLIPATLINIFPAVSSYDNVIKFNLSAGDGVKTIRVLLQDQSGKISDTINASVLVVSGQIADWEIKPIDSKSDFEKGLNIHALLVDSNGRPHIVYGNNELDSAVLDTSGWTIEKIKDSGTELGESPAGTFIDSEGNVHISYIDNQKNLIYATNSSGSWILTTVDDAGSAGGYAAITQGIMGIHISYYDRVNGRLKYAVCASECTDTKKWNLITVDSTGNDVGEYSSIMSGSDGSVHISYYDYTNHSLKYVSSNSQGEWSPPETVDESAGTFSSIALDSGSNAHIAYHSDTGELKYATNASDAWVIKDVDKNSIVTNYISVAVDAAGYVHIAYYDALSLAQKYASNTSGSWATATIDNNGNTGLYNRIVADSAHQKIHVSYFDTDAKAVRYAVCSSACTETAHWEIVRVSSSGDAGRYNSLFRDNTGKIHVSYIGGSDLRYAENSTGEWRSAVIDKVGTPGECSSMAVDSLGITHISCYDVDNRWLKYATCKADCTVPDHWTSVTVDNGINDTGVTAGFAYLSLAVGAEGGINVSYYDMTSRSLKYAYCSADCTDDKDVNGLADNWTKIIIDTNAVLEIGQYSSIAVSDTGTKKYISYFDRTNGDLKTATCDGNCTEDSNGDGTADNWIIKTIDEGKVNPNTFFNTTDSTGLYTSVKTDTDGYVHISYFDDTSGDLMYATNKSGQWEEIAVDSYDRAGIYTALTIGADDKVYIAYYRYSPGLSVLKYAVCSSVSSSGCTTDNQDNLTDDGGGDGVGDNWTSYVVAMFDNPGMFVSMTTDTNSDIHIVYYDPDTGGLNYTTGQ